MHSKDLTVAALVSIKLKFNLIFYSQFKNSIKHSDMEQRECDVILRAFRSGSARVIITTDLLARCNEVEQLSLVINYDLPNKRENYIKRYV